MLRLLPAGATSDYSYDDDDLLTQAGTFTLNRDATTGRVTSVTDGGITVTPSYTMFAEVDGMDYSIGATSKADWDLAFNDFGEIVGKDDTVGTNILEYAYHYDDLGQLTNVSDVSGASFALETYTYDENGNRLTSWTTAQGSRDYEYDDDDRLLGYDEDADGTNDVTYEYDKDGFLTKKTDGTDVTTYDYSSRGELLKVVLPDTTEIEYVHGLGGERLAKKVDGTITEKYLWSGVRLLAIYNASNVLVTRFENAGMTHNGTRYYFTHDQVGSLRSIYDTAGVLKGEIIYDSFGNELTNTIPASLEIPIGFAGGYTDRNTGLVRFGYRDYDPDVGRWTAKDPIGFSGGDTDPQQSPVLNHAGNSSSAWMAMGIAIVAVCRK